MAPKILITRNVGPEAMAKLEATDFELIVNPVDGEPTRAWVLEKVADPEVIAACIMHGQPSDKVDREFLDAASPNLKVVSTFSVGFDHIDVPYANSKGIKIGHTPGVLSNAVADTTVMLVLMTMRRVEEGIRLIKDNEWPNLPWAPFVMCGPAIGHPNLTIGFLGFGRISECVVERLLSFTSKTAPPTILYSNSRARDNQAAIDAEFSSRFGVKVARADKDDVAAKSDIVIVLCSQSPATIYLVNADFLKKMKKTAVLVNAARGPIVNSEDLAAALDAGEIFGAGLDVITGEPKVYADHPLVKHPKCVVIPHMGSADYDTRNAMADLCVSNAIAGATGQPLIAEVKV
ncbi:Glyoxylate reductase/hydroxypyruvate reductase [Vanrija pseudolonga]|uniref:Glyoxylate reductase/hydroxypyruvate reductase n=1 Tax=Vanrija pseudolonga TaxID=143232 RepID=A0AAF0Y2G8_9TREE|nr:Glyoxylate reductase/hydroxypyruvate reductase [Vanrija pseudolonga]